MSHPLRAISVHEDGTEDGWAPAPGWFLERTPMGDTRLVVSVPPDRLARVHAALIRAMQPPLGFLWRQHVDRNDPRPNGAPPHDYLALELSRERVLDALAATAGVVYHDARAELWIKGDLGEQLVLDQDGILYGYPDDPSWKDALAQVGVPEADVDTLADRDYVKHHYHVEHDAQEADLVARLRLTRVAARGG